MFEITGFSLPYFGRENGAVFDPRLAAVVLQTSHTDASFACQFRGFSLFLRWKKAAHGGSRGGLTEYARFMEDLLRVWGRDSRGPLASRAFLEMMAELHTPGMRNHDGWYPESSTTFPACPWPPLARLAERI